MAFVQTNVIMAQPMPMAAGNPKLLGSVHGVREWSNGLCGCMSDCTAGNILKNHCTRTAQSSRGGCS